MKKNIIAIFLVFIFSSLIFAQNVSVGVPSGLNGIPFIYMQTYADKIADFTVEYDTNLKEDILIKKFSEGIYDITVLSLENALKLYSEDNQLFVCAAICAGKKFSLVTKNSDIKTFEKLAEKKVYVPNDELILNSFVTDVFKDIPVELDFTLTSDSIKEKLIAGTVEYGILSEENFQDLKQKNKSFKNPLQINPKIKQKNFPAYIIAVKKDFASSNKKFLKAFLKEYDNAIYWTNTNPIKVKLLNLEYAQIDYSSDFIKTIIPESRFYFMDKRKSKKTINSFLKYLISQNTQSQDLPDIFGGIFYIPDNNFYF